jgi:hypothetical protein
VNAAELAGLLAEPSRLQVVAALALGATTAAEVAERTGLDVRTTHVALVRLEAGGLVTTNGAQSTLRTDAIGEAARQSAQRRASDEPGTGDPDTDAVLRAFLVDGALVRVPASRAKRLKVLEHIAMAFEPGIRYPEREVNAILRAWHADYAALRRYLVDEQLLAREAGEYWRVGGPVVL